MSDIVEYSSEEMKIEMLRKDCERDIVRLEKRLDFLERYVYETFK